MTDILVAGGGFAGMWACLTAAHEIRDNNADLTVTLISRAPNLTIRPRLYEARPQDMQAPLGPSLRAMGVKFIQGNVTGIDASINTVTYDNGDGHFRNLSYRKLVLSTGSVAHVPDVPGFDRFAYSIDDLHSAIQLDNHLAGLSSRLTGAAIIADNTFVIIGAGFTGIELACEMRDRIAVHAGEGAAGRARILLLDSAPHAGAGLGPGPRQQIYDALQAARIDVRTGVTVAQLRHNTVCLTGGEEIHAATIILTAGQRALVPPGLEYIARDAAGRLLAGDDLRIQGTEHCFVAGDSAAARVDDEHNALMSCQHAMPMGKHAGYNAVCDLLGMETRTYRQPDYVTCLDLGRSGAVFTTGWERSVQKTGAEAGALKRIVNTQWIYPPSGTADEIHEISDIDKRPGR